jgi:phage shock protein PspC (stress-responsive transcriptional regulator)
MDRYRCRRRVRGRCGGFGEPLTIARILAAALIVAGLTIMKLTMSA